MAHPGVVECSNWEDFLVGGPIWLFEEIRESTADLYPAETRVLFDRMGWDTVVGFQTRNAPHRGHEYLQKTALEHVDGLLVQPKIGDKKDDDYSNEAILSAYRTLIENYYPENTVSLSVFPSKMHYAGPREAVFDALVRKNQGCTHFVIGRDHAGVKDFYDGYDAHRIFDGVGDIDIELLFYSMSFYCTKCDGMASEKICPHSDEARQYPSGSRIRKMIRRGDSPPPEIMRSEVTNHILSLDQPFVGDSTGEE
jgi:sulfate adenylyltransferase